MVIVAAVDGTQSPDETVRVGKDLADAYDDDLVVVHVMPEEQFEVLNESSLGPGEFHTSEIVRYVGEDAADRDLDVYDLEKASADAESVAERVVRETLDDRGHVRWKGRVGNVTEEILAEGTESDARYLVVGGRKRTRVGKALFGSTTQSVMLSADRPVVAVMREG